MVDAGALALIEYFRLKTNVAIKVGNGHSDALAAARNADRRWIWLHRTKTHGASEDLHRQLRFE